MRWKIAEAKQRFSEVIRAAREEPQVILNRDRVVAALIDPLTFQAYEAWCAREQRSTLADAFTTLRSICAEEGYALEPGARRDRPNIFADALSDLSV